MSFALLLQSLEAIKDSPIATGLRISALQKTKVRTQRADGTGRVVTCEIMRQTKTIQECIAEPSKTFMLKEYIEKGRELSKMQTFDQHLTDLYREGIVNLETAKSAATSAADFERNLQFE